MYDRREISVDFVRVQSKVCPGHAFDMILPFGMYGSMRKGNRRSFRLN